MQGREVDEALMQERERDIKQINQDLVLVKEMFQGDVMSIRSFTCTSFVPLISIFSLIH